jgi:hypothetical protein
MREIMKRDRKTLGTLALMAGLLSATPAMAGDVQAVDIANKMSEVVDNLGKKQTGEPVQGEQKTIVRDLDDLIASLEKECENCKGGIKRNTKRGMLDSMISSSTGEIGPLTNPGDGGKDWGKLSDRERDRILQSMSEGFPPEYRTVLERYYRRLAEEKSAKAPGDPAKAKESARPTANAKP